MIWEVRFSHRRRGSAPSPAHHGPPNPASPEQFSLPLPGFAVVGDKAWSRVGGLKGQGKDGEPWSAGGRCLGGISRSAIDFPLSASRNMYGAEILINPHSAAHRSAAARGLLSKGSWGCKGELLNLGRPGLPLSALTPSCLTRKAAKLQGSLGSIPAPGSIPVGHPLAGHLQKHSSPSLLQCRCPTEPHF